MAKLSAFNNGLDFANISLKAGHSYDDTLMCATDCNPYKTEKSRASFIDGVTLAIEIDQTSLSDIDAQLASEIKENPNFLWNPIARRNALYNGYACADWEIAGLGGCHNTIEECKQYAMMKNPYKSAKCTKDFCEGIDARIQGEYMLIEQRSIVEDALKSSSKLDASVIITSTTLIADQSIPHVHNLLYLNKNNRYIKREDSVCTCEQARVKAHTSTVQACTYVTVTCQHLEQGVKPLSDTVNEEYYTNEYDQPHDYNSEALWNDDDCPLPTFEEQFASELRQSDAVLRVYGPLIGVQSPSTYDPNDVDTLPECGCPHDDAQICSHTRCFSVDCPLPCNCTCHHR